jgi:hypothetical protein
MSEFCPFEHTKKLIEEQKLSKEKAVVKSWAIFATINSKESE